MATGGDSAWKEPSREVILKLILVGNADSGKTSLLQRYVSGRFDPHTENTQAVDCINREVTVSDQRTIKVRSSWDHLRLLRR